MIFAQRLGKVIELWITIPVTFKLSEEKEVQE